MDPFSIAAAVGLAAGLTGFVVATIEKTAGTVSTAKHCGRRLRAHELSLKTCGQKLKDWGKRWHGRDGTSNRTFKGFWGPTGYNDIMERIAGILYEQKEILSILRGREWFERRSRDAIIWQTALDDRQRELQTRVTAATKVLEHPRNIDICCRVAIALWTNNLLVAAVSRLKDQVEALEYASKSHYYEARGSYEVGQDPPADALEAIKERHLRAERLHGAIWETYNMLSRQKLAVAFLLTPFENREAGLLDSVERMRMSFVASGSSFELHEDCYSIEIPYHLDQDDYSRWALSVLSRLRNRPVDAKKCSIGLSVQEELTRMLSLRPPLREMRMEMTRVQHMCTGPSIATWVSLLWGTPWVQGLSSCRMMQITSSDGLLPGIVRQRCTSRLRCCRERLGNRPYLVLAILLSEIALGCPIVARSDGERMICLLYETALQGDDSDALARRVKRPELLVKVGAASSPEYREAVRYCLDRDNLSSLDHPHDLQRFADKVITPIHNHSIRLRESADEQRLYYEEIRRLCNEMLGEV